MPYTSVLPGIPLSTPESNNCTTSFQSLGTPALASKDVIAPIYRIPAIPTPFNVAQAAESTS